MSKALMANTYDRLFYEALRIRMVEERIVSIYPSDKIQSPVHLSIGQEHHVAALMLALKKEDSVFSAYRCHAVYLAKGGSLPKMFAELYGKATGIAQGKAGSMHLCSPEVGMFGSSAVVSAVIPHALGTAYSHKIKKNNGVSVSITGDGSTEEGVFHECLNFAALKKLPYLIVIENNGLAIHAKVPDRQAYLLKDLAKAHKIPYFRSENGMDLDAVSKLSVELVEMTRRSGPVVFEIDTCRYYEHVGIRSDFGVAYRDSKEWQDWHAKDPLVNDLERVEKFKSSIESEINEAVDFAENSPFPKAEDLLKDVY